MTTTRRDFLRTAAIAGASLGTGASLSCTVEPNPDTGSQEAPLASERVGPPLKILVLGGTSFIGPPQVQHALDRGHEITLFNRGRTNTHLFPQVEKLVGDRADGSLDALRGRTWDVVIDNSATDPNWVRDSAQLLADSAERYFFVSTRSVYRSWDQVPMTAEAEVNSWENNPEVDRNAERLPYGLSKALAEAAAHEAFPGRTAVFRPGLIIGPGDPTDRFTYWPVRIHRGGEVLVPGDGQDLVQIIDVRDLCEWMIRMAEVKETGVYNCVGPKTPRPMDQLIYGIKAVTIAEAEFTWADTDFLMEREVQPYGEMPVWMPRTRPGRAAFGNFDLTPEVEKGLTFRSLADTTAATLEFHFSRTPERQAEIRPGLDAEREAEILAAWHALGR